MSSSDKSVSGGASEEARLADKPVRQRRPKRRKPYLSIEEKEIMMDEWDFQNGIVRPYDR